VDDVLLPWHKPYWHQLQQYIAQRHLPQALLVSGKSGLGKKHLARQFAASLLCTQPGDNGLACGHCRDCRLVSAATHPDIIHVQRSEDKAAIAVDQIRTLLAQASLKPQFDGHRIILIDPADALNANAANAFLKYLEEPTERTLVVLLTALPGKLPATIISRCQKLNLAIPGRQLALAWLEQQQPGLDGQEAEKAVYLAKGAPLLALEYAAEGMLAIYDTCFQAWLAVANQKTHPVMVAEQWQKWADKPILSWFADWLADLLKCRHKATAKQLNNPNLYKSLSVLAQRPLNPRKVFILYDLALENIRRQHTPVNKQLMFEELLIDWAQLTCHL